MADFKTHEHISQPPPPPPHANNRFDLETWNLQGQGHNG